MKASDEQVVKMMKNKQAPDGVSYFAHEAALFHMEHVLFRWQLLSAASLVAVALLAARKH